MRASPESPRMLQSDFLDFFTRTPWWVVPLIWIPIVCGLFRHGVMERGAGLLPAGAVAVTGTFIWTLSEYGLHRFFFHWKPDHSWGSRLHFLVHGVHHDWPQDRFRLVMPPIVGCLIAVPFATVFWLALGPVWFFPFFAGFLSGYICYDCNHYATHHLKWNNPVFQAVKKHHLLHHHSPQHKDRNYGVTSPLWDVVFGTM
jgi:sterol desaturase/sphingolipid hydroxylase (fatty acid hydroxylase superfamily)